MTVKQVLLIFLLYSESFGCEYYINLSLKKNKYPNNKIKEIFVFF